MNKNLNDELNLVKGVYRKEKSVGPDHVLNLAFAQYSDDFQLDISVLN